MQEKIINLQAGQTIEEILTLLDEGEEIIITRDNIPLARLSPLNHEKEIPQKRIASLHAGTPTWISDDLDDPLPDSL